MADIRAQVQAQLQAFKAAIDQSNQQVQELEGLMDNLDHEFESFASHLQSETQQHLKMLNGMTAKCHSLDSELTQVFTELTSTISAAEGHLDQEVNELEKESANLQRWNDGFVHKLEEADHDVERIVQDVGHHAQEAAHKIDEAANHIIETGHKTANKFGNELVDHVNSIHQKTDQVFHEFEQEANNHLHDLEQEVGNYGHHLTEQAQHFAEQAQNSGNEAKEKMMNTVHELEQGVMGHLGDLGQNVEHFHDSFIKMSEFITHLTAEGVETVDALGQAMDTVNVGLNGVAETVSNVKEILDEIGL